MLQKRLKFLAIFAIIIFLAYFPNKGKCSQEIQAELGEPCTIDDECLLGQSGDLSFCNSDGVCGCVPNSIENPAKDKCLKLAELIGDSCEISQQCTEGSPGGFSRCNTAGTCECNPLLAIPSRDDKRCLPIIDYIGGICEITEQCTNSDQDPNLKVCLSGKCQCAGEAVNAEGDHVCYPIVDLVDQSCVISEQCTASIGDLTECKGDICQCKVGAVPNLEGRPNSKCYPGGLFIGTSCLDTAQCVGDPPRSSICTQARFCDCRTGWTPTYNLDNCLNIQNTIGGECVESQQCQKGDPGEQSLCQDDKCQCTPDAITENDGHTCYKKAVHVGDECKVDAQCIPNLESSLCLNGRCQCMRDATESRDRTKCLLNRGIGESCVESGQCRHMGEAVCVTSGGVRTCQCDQGHIENPQVKNTCIKLASQIGEPCGEHPNQCGGLQGAHCSDEKICSCKEGEEVENLRGTKCLKLMDSLNDTCEESQQCQVTDSECRPISNPLGPRACFCKGGYVVGREPPNTCHPARHNIGDHCNDPAQCTMGMPGSVPCINHKCQCPNPLEFFNDFCVTPADLHQVCDNHDQCIVGVNNLTVCVATNGQPERRCTCVPAAIESENFCWNVKVVGDSCGRDAECYKSILGPVYCNNSTGKCACEYKYYPDAGGLRCSGAGGLISHLSVVSILSLVLMAMYFLEIKK